MNETDALHWHLYRYGAILSRQVDRLYNALEELERSTLLYLKSQANDSETAIDRWLSQEQFLVDDDGFFQSIPLLKAYREGTAPSEAISFSWGSQLRHDRTARRHLYSHRNIGPQLQRIHQRLQNVGWIYFQDAGNIALQYPFIDQATAIPADFDWSTYHTFRSVCPENNPERAICWTAPSIDYAGKGLILSVSIPVWQDERFIGLWSIDLPLRFLYQDFATQQAFGEQQQWITDNKGLLLLHDRLQAEINPQQGQLFLHPLSELGGDWADFTMDQLQGENGQLTMTDGEGIERIVAYLHISKVNWTLFCSMPTASLEEAAAKRLEGAFQQIADGHYGSKVASSSSNAIISTLIEGFNRMSQRLAQAEQEREQAEIQLRQSQKLEAIGRLAGGVAHDYNNMINVILGYAELALERVEPEDPLHRDLNQILEAAKRSMEITRQLLAFARCQNIAPRRVDLNTEIKPLLAMITRLIGEEIELRFYPGTDVYQVNIDPTQINQLLVNLCVNARDAIGGVGKIVVETTNTILDQTYCDLHPNFHPGEYAQLAISDDGAGMDEETQKNIFEPFFSTKEQGKGTGLGLATVYGIIKQNKGFINVYSEPGKGTTFRLYLPRDDGDSATSEGLSLAEGPPTAQGETVLVVEDEAGILNLVKRLLQELGYVPLVAASPQAAIQLATSHSGAIDLLITDVIMPQMNGRELAKELQKILPELKVLFMSGYTSNIIAKRGILDIDVILLQKPFTKQNFADKVYQALTSSTPLNSHS
ncbi:response regulator [Desulfobulbus rhabdoformis]|uniref:hybrid sensor histidine kinase/response regulator n=1 Tax=Desulfobulbus rhabdoformis TaxID=34032 RepID=UPI001962CE98|nr:ATP-binding protein [Desulfobulbus rhabdoformis]MBM9613229.1 response regulator [Desulfobulbus rhabdoformis]